MVCPQINNGWFPLGSSLQNSPQKRHYPQTTLTLTYVGIGSLPPSAWLVRRASRLTESQPIDPSSCAQSITRGREQLVLLSMASGSQPVLVSFEGTLSSGFKGCQKKNQLHPGDTCPPSPPNSRAPRRHPAPPGSESRPTPGHKQQMVRFVTGIRHRVARSYMTKRGLQKPRWMPCNSDVPMFSPEAAASASICLVQI